MNDYNNRIDDIFLHPHFIIMIIIIMYTMFKMMDSLNSCI